MNPSAHIRLMASYNEWMNDKLYQAASQLPAQELAAHRKAFFGSILGTLNHIVVADTLWLQRFAAHPAKYAELDPVRSWPSPAALNQLLFTDLADLARHRKMLDGVISRWAACVTEADLAQVLHYANTRGIVADKSFFSLLMHFFNHQTHHRGQATTLLSQAGIDVGVTDLVALIPNEPVA